MVLPPTEWMEHIIKIDSITHRSNEDVVRFLVPLLKESGLKVQEHRTQENGESFVNLLAFSHEVGTDKLLALNTHLDTVSFGERNRWTKTSGDPFQATRVRDRIYGLGSADVKLDFLCKIWAARVARPWKRPFVLVGTYGEERGLIGVQQLFKEKKIKPRYAMVGEPSNLELIYAHKGHIIFSFRVHLGAAALGQTKRWKGKSAHSSTPELGDNAIRKGLKDIYKRGIGFVSLSGGSDTNKIPEACEAVVVGEKTENAQRVFQLLDCLDELAADLRKRKDARFAPAFSTLSLNLARMQGEDCLLTFDIRVLPDANVEQIISRLERAAKTTQCRLESIAVDQPLKGQKNGRLMRAASDALKDLGVKVVKKTKASSTEAAVYNAHGAEAIVFGPGISIGNAHRPNEYNSFRQLGIATKFYSNLLRTSAETL